MIYASKPYRLIPIPPKGLSKELETFIDTPQLWSGEDLMSTKTIDCFERLVSDGWIPVSICECKTDYGVINIGKFTNELLTQFAGRGEDLKFVSTWKNDGTEIIMRWIQQWWAMLKKKDLAEYLTEVVLMDVLAKQSGS